MKKKTGAWLLAAAILVAAGLLLLAAALTMADGSFGPLGTDAFETNSYELSDSFRRIVIDTDTADITLLPSDDGVCRAVCYEPETEKTIIVVQDGTLSIHDDSEKQWYDFIDLNFQKPPITLYLPEREYDFLYVETDTGDIVIPPDFVFGSMDISSDTGDVTNAASAAGEIAVETDTGDIRMENLSAAGVDLSVSTGDIHLSGLVCEGSILTAGTTGHTNISDSSCLNFRSDGSTGDLSLSNVTAAGSFSVERSTGSVSFRCCDAPEIFVATDTGNVSGSFLSPKIFQTETSTGDVDVPDSLTGGLCEIRTRTGDIEIFLVE